MPLTLKELAQKIGAELTGDASLEICSASTLEEAGPGQVTFLANPKYLKHLETTKASAAIVAPNISSGRMALLKAQDPYYAFMQAVVALHGHRKHPHEGIHSKAHVDPTATVGDGTVIYPGVYVGPRAKIGRDCILFPNVAIYDDCVLGDRVTIHACTSIGHDGFGYSTQDGVHHKIPQVGNVVIEDDVEIGANCSIDRATLGSTIIGKGTKFSNNIAIGHGSKVGAHCLFVAQVGIAGSVNVGHHVTLGGQVGVAGHLKIGDNVSIGAKAGVMDDIPDKSVYMGAPAVPGRQAKRIWAATFQLPELIDRIRQLEAKLEALEGKS